MLERLILRLKSLFVHRTPQRVTISSECIFTDIDDDSCTCCTPIGMSREIVERAATKRFGCTCAIVDEHPENPHKCDEMSDRYHWLLAKL